MVNDDQLSEEALDELAQAGWRQSTTGSTPELLTSLSREPSGEMLPSLDTNKEVLLRPVPAIHPRTIF